MLCWWEIFQDADSCAQEVRVAAAKVTSRQRMKVSQQQRTYTISAWRESWKKECQSWKKRFLKATSLTGREWTFSTLLSYLQNWRRGRERDYRSSIQRQQQMTDTVSLVCHTSDLMRFSWLEYKKKEVKYKNEEADFTNCKDLYDWVSLPLIIIILYMNNTRWWESRARQWEENFLFFFSPIQCPWCLTKRFEETSTKLCTAYLPRAFKQWWWRSCRSW